mmetsp:Transcript_98433/g.278365  ORF Transcript_98433/g.278365 Transcript_98433/m.278365 type:complete len:95 (+) Transcript_98433:945-1229(+)
MAAVAQGCATLRSGLAENGAECGCEPKCCTPACLTEFDRVVFLARHTAGVEICSELEAARAKEPKRRKLAVVGCAERDGRKTSFARGTAGSAMS